MRQNTKAEREGCNLHINKCINEENCSAYQNTVCSATKTSEDASADCILTIAMHPDTIVLTDRTLNEEGENNGK